MTTWSIIPARVDVVPDVMGWNATIGLPRKKGLARDALYAPPPHASIVTDPFLVVSVMRITRRVLENQCVNV